MVKRTLIVALTLSVVLPAGVLYSEVPKVGGAGALGRWFLLEATCGDLISLLERSLAPEDAIDPESWAKVMATSYIYGRIEQDNKSSYSQERDKVIATCTLEPESNFHVVLRRTLDE